MKSIDSRSALVQSGKIKDRFNQYQANHSAGPTVAGARGWLRLSGLVIVLLILMLLVWLFA